MANKVTTSAANGNSDERTDVFYGAENVLKTELQIFSNATEKIDSCMNFTRPQLAVELELIKKAFIDAKSRGLRIRYLTEITPANVSFCKELMSIVDELRHLDGIKGNFMISQSEYCAPSILYRKAGIAPQIIYSNIREVIEHQQYIFDTFWSKGIAAEKKIKEIEEGVFVHYETRVLEDDQEISHKIRELVEYSDELLVCSSFEGMQMIYDSFLDSYKKVLDKSKKGEHKGIRWIGNIEKQYAKLVKAFLDLGVQVKDVKKLPAMHFVIGNMNKGRELQAAIEYSDGEYVQKDVDDNNDDRGLYTVKKTLQSLLITNEPGYINHFSRIFEELWKKGIDAKDRIADIENGIEAANVEIIENPKGSINRAYDISMSAKEELLVAFSTTNSFQRNMRTGLSMQLLKDQYTRSNTKVRILTPVDERIFHSIEELKRTLPLVSVRDINGSIEAGRITILLADRKECLIIEIKDDTKDNLYEAAGLSIYSDSKSIVSSYLSIFERLWKQSELYEQLKAHDKMQEEFINVAAHELRTPIQPILGLAEHISSRIKEGKIGPKEQNDLLNVVIRNARRLQQLTEDILDVTRIEGKSLKLRKEQFSLNDVILGIIENHRNIIQETGSNIKLLYRPLLEEETVVIEADKARISQVISNLVNNAVMFTKEGIISIEVKKEKKSEDDGDDNNDKEEFIVVSVKDSGIGIDSDIEARLFSKFSTKSYHGTGLSLYISKNIVDAHGGRIWAENDPNGGATFSFTLPINK